MSQEPENILRRSLDATDRHRRRLTWVLALASVAVAAEFLRLAVIKPTGDVPGLIVEAVLVLFFCMLAVTVVIVFQLNIATKRILRAIELTSRPTE